MKIVPKVCILFLLLPASLFAQPGVRMSADFLPLEVGNRWVYDLLSENGQKLGALDVAVQEYRIVGGRSFYLLTSFPFVTEDTTPTRLIRYDAKITNVHVGERQAAQAAAQGAPALPQPGQPATPEQRNKALTDNVAKVSEENPALDVQVSEVPGGMRFVFTVINTSDKLLPFNFRSGQTYDFEVIDASTGQEVWRWSRRMFFSQVVRQEAIRGSRNWVFEVTWNHRDNDLNVVAPGKYKVIGSLATQPPIESEAVSFDIK